jgi:hypothetical protein
MVVFGGSGGTVVGSGGQIFPKYYLYQKELLYNTTLGKLNPHLVVYLPFEENDMGTGSNMGTI